MAFTDLITGLAFVNAHVGFYRLDKELRQNINIPIEKLQAHVQLLARSAEAVTISNQIQQLKGQANKLLKQQLNAQHAQLMVQVGQLQLQLQQLQVERQRLELEVKKEQRLTQENEILRIFVDFYDQAQTYRQQGQLLDYLVVVFATFRIYRQVYSDLDDANNRLRISELKEKLFQGLREIMESPQSRQNLVASYAKALQVPIALVQKGHQFSANAAKSISEINQLRQLPPGGKWSDSLNAADSCLTQLEAAKEALVASRTEYTAFVQGLDLREFFFPTYGDNINALVSGMAEAWAEWLNAVEISAGNRLTQLSSSLQEDPTRFEQQEKEVVVAIEEVKELHLTHQLGHAAVHLAQITPVYLTRFQELHQQFNTLVIPASGDEPGQVLDVCLALQQLKIALSSEFASFQEFAKTNSRANESKYLQLATPRMQEINATEETMPLSQIATAFSLHRDIDKLSTEITKALKTCTKLLDKAVETDDMFEKLQQHIREILPESEVQEIETQTASYQPGTVGQILSSVRGDKGKEIDRRRRLIDNLLEMYAKVHPLPVAQLPNITDAPPFPALTPGTKISTRKPTSSDQKPESKKLPRRLVVIGGLVILIGCACFMLLVISRPSPQSTETPLVAGTQTPEVVGLVNTSEPTNTPKPTDTPKSTNTPVPTDTPPPTTNTPTLTNTPQSTKTPTSTSEPTPTELPTTVALETETTVGMGISRDSIQTTYENMWDFTFEDAAEVDGHPRVLGNAPNKLALVELIGRDEDLASASVFIFLPNDNPQAVTENTLYMLQLLTLVAPDWNEGVNWLTDNLVVAKEQGDVKTTYGNLELTLGVAKELGMVSLTARGTEQTDSAVTASTPIPSSIEDTPVPPTPTPIPPTPVPIPAAAEIGVEKAIGAWGLKLYDVKRAKAVWFFDEGTYAQGVWFIPFVEFKNNGSGTRNPDEDLTLYFVDDTGRTFEFNTLVSDGILGAAHQFTTGHYYDDINPGLILGISLPIDTPEDLGGVWLKVEEDPNFSIYLGKANEVPIIDKQ